MLSHDYCAWRTSANRRPPFDLFINWKQQQPVLLRENEWWSHSEGGIWCHEGKPKKQKVTRFLTDNTRVRSSFSFHPYFTAAPRAAIWLIRGVPSSCTEMWNYTPLWIKSDSFIYFFPRNTKVPLLFLNNMSFRNGYLSCPNTWATFHLKNKTSWKIIWSLQEICAYTQLGAG